MNLDTKAKRERRLRMKLADPIRRLEPQPRSVHIYERSEEEKMYTAGHVAFWIIVGVVCGIILGVNL